MSDKEERVSAPLSDKQTILNLLDQLIEIIETLKQLVDTSESLQEGS